MARPRQCLLKALYDYSSRSDRDMSFEKGDRMELVDDSDANWWRVFHQLTRCEGYVPANYVADESSLECEDWFFPDTSRAEAEHFLMARGNPPGTFLVRSAPAAATAGPAVHQYTLSVKDHEPRRVKHYKIRPDGHGGFYINPRHTFFSLPTLIAAYCKLSHGFDPGLTTPCPKPTPQMLDLVPAIYDEWEISRNEIQLVRKLGTGHFGDVYYGLWNNTSEVAVKTLKAGTMSTQAFLEEAAIMKKLRHKRLVALYAVCTQESPIYIVQEYMSRGSLLDFLRTGEGNTYKFEELIYIAAQVANGMHYLESKLLIHRDLAARNVLMDEDNTAKIGDFGLARVIENDVYSMKRKIPFPVKWTAPEALVYGVFSIKSDVWSFGILLMELFTKGQVPYPGMSGSDVAKQIQQGYRMPKPLNPELPEDIYDLMLKCWDENPDKRPTFDFLYDYFEGFRVTSENVYKEPQQDQCKRKTNVCVLL